MDRYLSFPQKHTKWLDPIQTPTTLLYTYKVNECTIPFVVMTICLFSHTHKKGHKIGILIEPRLVQPPWSLVNYSVWWLVVGEIWFWGTVSLLQSRNHPSWIWRHYWTMWVMQTRASKSNQWRKAQLSTSPIYMPTPQTQLLSLSVISCKYMYIVI